MQPLLLRSTPDRRTPFAAELPETLVVDDTSDDDEIPTVTGELPRSAARPLRLLLRVHNAAGVPIVAGETRVDVGATRIEFRGLHALGIEAYAHVPADERVRIARRIWSRRAYGVLEAGE